MLLTNATVIDGTGRAPLERASVRIEDGRIVEGGSLGAEATGPDGAVDLDGRPLMPGLIDAHAHLSSDVFRSPGFGPPAELHGELPRPRALGYFILAKTARVLLGAGITTVRDVGSYDEMRKAVPEQLRRGADYVKLMATGARSVLVEDPEPAQMTPPELAAVVDEAHRLGARVAAHVEGLAGARLAVRGRGGT